MTTLTISSVNPPPVIGCDVGKAAIVVFDSRNAKTRTLRNDPDVLAAFAAELDADCLVICEATGGHEAALLNALLQAGRHAHRADARKVKAFIRSFGILGKTDAIDARALATYGRERHAQLVRWKLPDGARDRLQTLVLTRQDLVIQRVAWNNRLKAPAAAPVKDYLRNILDCLKTQIDAIEADISSIIQNNQSLAKAKEALTGIKGIGNTTAAALLALMPELGTLNRKTAAALAGVAPHPNQSGASDAYRRTKGGRPEIKRALFMAALVASRQNTNLKAVYQRLIENGKKPLVALTAIMRKIIVIANAILKPIYSTQVS